MKTTLEIVNEHIEKAKTLSQDPFAIAKEAIRMSQRIENDPALMALAASMGDAVATAMHITHDPDIQSAIQRGIIIRAIMEWEAVKAEADNQFKTSPQ